MRRWPMRCRSCSTISTVRARRFQSPVRHSDSTKARETGRRLESAMLRARTRQYADALTRMSLKFENASEFVTNAYP